VTAEVTAELVDNHVTVAEQLHVEAEVPKWLAVNQHLRDV